MIGKILRVFSLLVFGISLIVRLPLRRGRALYLTPIKILGSSLSPFLVLVGSLAGLVGWVKRERLAAFAGLLGAALASRHIQKVTRPHNTFESTFSPDWGKRIPPGLTSRLRSSRYTPLAFNVPHVSLQHDVPFSVHRETRELLQADLWEPPRHVPRTGLGLIYLHGSAWHYLHKDFMTRTFFSHLAGQGHVIMDVAYTLAPKADLSAMLADVKRAIAWMKTHGGRYGVDPYRVVLIGASSGGHLALLAAYTPNHPSFQPVDLRKVDTSIRGVVSYYGITELFDEHETLQGVPAFAFPGAERILHLAGFLHRENRFVASPDLLPSLLDGSPEEVPEKYRAGSPLSHVGPHCPPTLLIHGAHDFGVKADQSKRLHAALCEAGVPSVCIELPETSHAFDLFFPRWSPAFHTATYDTERFLSLLL